ncbi:MAG: rRNA maturation RNase YbeY [Alphaproteobacteria bacterium]|nr:rRNA maturation RNase YbeY [Alphaproteobacteria bacterium]
MNNCEVDVSIQTKEWGDVPDVEDICIKAATTAFNVGKTDSIDSDKQIEISVLLTGDDFICELNRDYRGQDKPTNVLSFATIEYIPQEEIEINMQVGDILLGDVVISFETTSAEAKDENKTLEAHLSHLVAHGVLHLLGYDHEKDAEAEIMEKLEIRVLAELNISSSFLERTEPS